MKKPEPPPPITRRGAFATLGALVAALLPRPKQAVGKPPRRRVRWIGHG
ncbi:MAG TPA: hypothetical protein VNO33_12490 [Kofleriaceae bacterium]|nr:hypothetical protein [Kofleriaceae bacterium]